MANLRDIEVQILSLEPADREQIALVAWDSLDADVHTHMTDEDFRIAESRNAEIESGAVEPIDHSTFLERTGGG